MSLLPDTFWSLTWGEFWRMRRGYLKRLDNDNKVRWSHTSSIMSLMWNLNQRQRKIPNDFLPEAYQGETETLPQSDEAAFEKRKKHSERFNKGVKKEVM